MAFENALREISLIAAADLSAKQFYAVVVDANGLAALQTSAGGRADGILQNKPLSGNVAEVAIDGVAKVACGAAVTAGDALGIDATGRAITYSSGIKIGTALSTTTAAGQIFSALLHLQS